ncbi:MAG: PepSY domain-containing protein [Myxococcales bacterium]|nr:PepSY domain-containing protein [Myxococcales bacterium]
MKRRAWLVGLALGLGLGLVACGGDETGTTPPTAEEAEKKAGELVGGTASGAEQVQEDGHSLWEMKVAMDNGATLTTYLFADTLELFEIKDLDGPFDYDGLDPLPGMLTYSEARAIAFETQAGTQRAWEVKYDDGPYFYEFYVIDSSEQLWEIKLWADTGEVFVTEPKSAID